MYITAYIFINTHIHTHNFIKLYLCAELTGLCDANSGTGVFLSK